MRAFFLISISVLLFGCGGAAEEPAIRVAATADMRYALEEINNRFSQIYGAKVKLTTDASGRLSRKIKQNGSFDIFISASPAYADSLYRKSLAVAEPQFIAKGVLVAWSPLSISLDDSLNILRSSEIRRVAIGDPVYSSHGAVAKKICTKLELPDTVFRKFLFANNSSQIVDWIKNKHVDVAFLGKAVAVAPVMAGYGHWVELDTTLYSPLNNTVLKLKSNNKRMKQQIDLYYNFLFSIESQLILEKYGYHVQELQVGSFF